uniref:Ig-like domain-containing protein n=1 Tax=Amphilophus citrinellus TaxID=61819 RepID=A0A3Q0RKU0_AMPCI
VRFFLPVFCYTIYMKHLDKNRKVENVHARFVVRLQDITGRDIVIHWFKVPGDLHVHSYYYSKDQLGHQDQRFRNRTSLFKDQISRGNASLQLTGVQVQDQGRYKCHTSTIRGNMESFINLKVDGRRNMQKTSIFYFIAAPVHEVSIDQVGNRITCSSEGIYPEPQLTWSTSPPSNITFTNTTTVQQPEQLLYSITSSLMVSAGVYDLLFILTLLSALFSVLVYLNIFCNFVNNNNKQYFALLKKCVHKRSPS